MEEKKKEKLFKRFETSKFTKEAEKHLEDKNFLKNLVEQAQKLSPHLKKAGEQVQLLISYVFGKNSNWTTRLYAISALIYFISPIDFIPDFIPGVGYLDDIAIIGMVVSMITHNITKAKSKDIDNPISENLPAKKETDPQNLHKPWVDEQLDNIFGKVGSRLEETTQKQVNQRIHAQLIIVIISISGAILAATITLILKYVLKVN